MTNLTMFDTVHQLKSLTGGLSDNELNKNGFVHLDSWDFGFVTDEPIDYLVSQNSGFSYRQGRHEHIWTEWIVQKMNSYTAGYEHVEYKGKHYYMVYRE